MLVLNVSPLMQAHAALLLLLLCATYESFILASLTVARIEVRKYGNEEEDAPTISIVTQNE